MSFFAVFVSQIYYTAIRFLYGYVIQLASQIISDTGNILSSQLCLFCLLFIRQPFCLGFMIQCINPVYFLLDIDTYLTMPFNCFLFMQIDDELCKIKRLVLICLKYRTVISAFHNTVNDSYILAIGNDQYQPLNRL